MDRQPSNIWVNKQLSCEMVVVIKVGAFGFRRLWTTLLRMCSHGATCILLPQYRDRSNYIWPMLVCLFVQIYSGVWKILSHRANFRTGVNDHISILILIRRSASKIYKCRKKSFVWIHPYLFQTGIDTIVKLRQVYNVVLVKKTYQIWPTQRHIPRNISHTKAYPNQLECISEIRILIKIHFVYLICV